MKSLNYALSFLTAIATSLTSGLMEITLSQSVTFTHEETTYIVNLKKSRGQELAFNLSYPGANGVTHIVEYQGTCGANTIGVLGETVLNSSGEIISKNTAVQAIIFDISPNNKNWEMSGVIRQALALMCDSIQ